MNQYHSNRHAHSVGWSTWHFEWCTKYRYDMFRKEYIKNICVIGIHEAARRHTIEVIDYEIATNHIHVIASIPLTMSPAKAMNLLKGYSARLILAEVPNIRKRYPKGHLWSPGKFVASIGHITLERAKKYLEDHHAK